MKRRWLPIAVVFMCAACARSAPPAEPVDAVPVNAWPTLQSTEWQLVDAVVGGRRLPLDGVDAVLRFDVDGGFSAKACNSLLGEVEVGPTELTFESHFTSAILCYDGSMDVDEAFAGLGGQPTSWSVADEKLTLTGAATLTYRVRSSIDPTVGGTETPAGGGG